MTKKDGEVFIDNFLQDYEYLQQIEALEDRLELLKEVVEYPALSESFGFTSTTTLTDVQLEAAKLDDERAGITEKRWIIWSEANHRFAGRLAIVSLTDIEAGREVIRVPGRMKKVKEVKGTMGDLLRLSNDLRFTLDVPRKFFPSEASNRITWIRAIESDMAFEPVGVPLVSVDFLN